MKAKISSRFIIYFSNYPVENANHNAFDEADFDEFSVGDEVTVLKVVDDDTYESGKCYIIHNEETNAVARVDAFFLEFE